MKKFFIIIRLLVFLLLGWVTDSVLFAQDMGASAYSKLTWDDIASVSNGSGGGISGTIGLTTDKKMYVWGSNYLYTIHTNSVVSSASIQYPIKQRAPFYVPSPAGETIKKVGIQLSPYSGAEGTLTAPIYFCLSEGGKLYAWGINNGLVATAWPVASATFTNTLADTTKTKRRPIQLTILGETEFVDFGTSRHNYWVAIGASGKAYHIGKNGPTEIYTFEALPNPTGVDNATFKYTNVWCSEVVFPTISMYLKGNNGKIYYTGIFNANYSSGVALIFPRNTPVPTVTSNENAGYVRAIAPREVPFPAGEDIIKMSVNNIGDGKTNYALSASGKAYIAGKWREYGQNVGGIGQNTFVVAPLKTAPLPGTEDIYSGAGDTIHTLKSFVEMAMPPGATKIIDIMSVNPLHSVGTLVVGDNNKVYYSGSISDTPIAPEDIIFRGNYLSVSNYLGYSVETCNDLRYTKTNSYYSWTDENINYEGTAKLVARINSHIQLGLISKTGRGYFVGQLAASTGTGKTGTGSSNFYNIFPVPIANEELLSCQTSAGPGGTWTGGPTNTGVGIIDCTKTQLSPAPTLGVVSQLDLIITINVTTAGTFTPITVSGSGMTAANNITSITTNKTGIQQFHIPMNYNGSALSTFNFTIGSAGSCSANLAQQPSQKITNVWSLNNCSAISPGTLSK